MRGFEKINLNIPLRVNIAFGVAFSLFFCIGLRLWYLQVLKGDYFRFRSENNLLRTIFVPPPRGLILDRKGEILVKNRPSFDVDLITEDCPRPKETLTELAHILGYDPQVLLDKMRDQRKRKRFEPKLILKDVSRDVVAKVEAQRYRLPGIGINVVPARDYVQREGAAHVLGYIREITRDQLDNVAYAGYMMGDLVGQYGIESRWERYLRGDRGYHAVIVNAGGVKIGERSFKSEIIGHNVSLTIAADVQRAADEALTSLKGAIVAMNPNTGEILALASSPRFDPNIFTSEISPEVWQDLVSGREKKLNNRAVQGGFPPGSVFKIFMAVAALAEGVISPNDHINCPGYFNFGGRPFRCHKKAGHGPVDLKSALIQSCDVYFYTVGQRLGIDRIHDYATRFGLGMQTGLELVEENKGIIPSTEWKKNYFSRPEDQKWYPGETISVSIGQGAVVTTPLQIARGLSALINGGAVWKPYIVQGIRSVDGSFEDDAFKPEQVGVLDVDPKIINIVRDALVGVVNDPRGTARRAQLDKEFNITVAGKTGTAQAIGGDGPSRGEHLNDHAWFAAYAPAEKPEIVVVALVENGGHGGVTSAPLVKKVMEAFFADRRRKPEESEERAAKAEKPGKTEKLPTPSQSSDAEASPSED